jgi:hypothetical protein
VLETLQDKKATTETFARKLRFYRRAVLEGQGMRINELKIGSRWKTQDGVMLYVWCVTNVKEDFIHPPTVVLKEEKGVHYYSMFLELFPFDLTGPYPEVKE